MTTFFKENILCTIEAKQLQIDLNESGGSKKLDAVKRFVSSIQPFGASN